MSKNETNAGSEAEIQYNYEVRMTKESELKAATNPNETGSKLVDELKPCPFCGKTGMSTISGKAAGCPNGCAQFHGMVLMQEWNNAWAHKQIAELESRLENEKHWENIRKNQGEKDLKEILSLQSQLESEKAKYEMQLKFIGELNAENAALKYNINFLTEHMETINVNRERQVLEWTKQKWSDEEKIAELKAKNMELELRLGKAVLAYDKDVADLEAKNAELEREKTSLINIKEHYAKTIFSLEDANKMLKDALEKWARK